MTAASAPASLPQLKALSVGELLDYAATLYRDHFLTFFLIAAISELISYGIEPINKLAQVDTQSAAVAGMLAIVLAIIWFFAFIFVTGLSQAATTFAVTECYFDRPISALSAYRKSARFALRIVGLIFVTGIRIGLASLALVVPGILLTLKYSVAIPVAVLEDKRTGDSIRRSGDLTKGEYKRIFPIYVLFWVLSFVFGALAQYISAVPAVANLFGPAWLQGMQLLGQFISSTIVQPVLTISLAVLYFDLRVRKEGFDLQMMLQQLSEHSPETVTPISLPPASPAH